MFDVKLRKKMQKILVLTAFLLILPWSLYSQSILFSNVVTELAAMGPRFPQAPGHTAIIQYISATGIRNGWKAVEQPFSYEAGNGKAYAFSNVVLRFNPDAANRIFFTTHFDSKRRAERELNDSLAAIPPVTVNDGLSGTALLLTMLDTVKNLLPDTCGIDFVFFDGEDFGLQNNVAEMCLGSGYFTSNPPENFSPSFGILLDMIGDKDARFPKEGYSVQYAATLTDSIWGIAKELELPAFVSESSTKIYDDHVMFRRLKIPVTAIMDVCLIDGTIRDSYWHTHRDDLSVIDEGTISQVRKLLIEVLKRFGEKK